MELSLIGILSELAIVLTNKAISIYARSTFNTDYILVDRGGFKKATNMLRDSRYTIPDDEKE